MTIFLIILSFSFLCILKLKIKSNILIFIKDFVDLGMRVLKYVKSLFHDLDLFSSDINLLFKKRE